MLLCMSELINNYFSNLGFDILRDFSVFLPVPSSVAGGSQEIHDWGDGEFDVRGCKSISDHFYDFERDLDLPDRNWNCLLPSLGSTR